ncbi:MAG: hypothetical protein GY866_04410 [Proteobacteria bacterium]|nr:hypothetical protein [Pseudomonadota bacterium]
MRLDADTAEGIGGSAESNIDGIPEIRMRVRARIRVAVIFQSRQPRTPPFINAGFLPWRIGAD